MDILHQNNALKKLAKEIEWEISTAFQHGYIDEVKRSKDGQLKIVFHCEHIVPFGEFENFYHKLVAHLPIVGTLRFKSRKLAWEVPLLYKYLIFVLQEKIDALHLSLLIKEQQIQKDDSVSCTVKFTSQNATKSFEKIREKAVEELERLGFPKLNIATETVEEDVKILEDEHKRLQKSNEVLQTLVTERHATEQKITQDKKLNVYQVLSIKEVRQNYFTKATIRGKIFAFEKIRLPKREDLLIYQWNIVDKDDAIYCKLYVRSDEEKKYQPEILDPGNFVEVRGQVTDDNYSKEKVIVVSEVKLVEYKEYTIRKDYEPRLRVELCARTKMSAFDGVTDVKKLVARATAWNHSAVGIADLENVQAFPDLYHHTSKIPNFKVLYGATLKVLSRDPKIVANLQARDLGSEIYVVFDLETTGLYARFNEIIEFGAVKIQHGNVIEKLQFFVNINKAIPLFITNLTGIRNEDLEGGMTPRSAIKRIVEFVGEATLVAHNAVFDMAFIYKELAKFGLPKITNPVIDTLPLSRALLNQKSHTLQRVCKTYGIEYDVDVAHRADYDANVLAKVFVKMLTTLKELDISDLATLKNWLKPVVYEKRYPNTITVFAKNQEGLTELFKLISDSHTINYYRKPIVFLEDFFATRSANLLVGSSDYNSEIFEIALSGDDARLVEAMQNYDFIEVQPPSNFRHWVAREQISEKHLHQLLADIIKIAKECGKKVVATSHSRYIDLEDKIFHKILINTKGLGGTYHDLYKFNEVNPQYPDLHLRTTSEMKREFSFLQDKHLVEEIVVENTNYIADQIAKIKVIKEGLFPPKLEDVDLNYEIENLVYANARKKYGKNLHEIIEKRIKKELSAIFKYKYGVIYWLSHKLVAQSLADGYLVGSRGSVGSSIVATLMNITEVNPLAPHYFCTQCNHVEFANVKGVGCGYDLPTKKCAGCHQDLQTDGHDIPFETFLGFEGDKIPDIDLNFSGEYQNVIHQKVKDFFDDNHAFRAGTISTIAERTAFGYVKGYQEKLETEFSNAFIDYLVKGIEGTKRTTGQHPGGIIVVPRQYAVEDFTPINYPANDTTATWKTTHFDFHAIHDNLLKLDLLGHDDPTAIKMLETLTNVKVDKIPNFDQRVIAIFSSPQELGVTPKDIMGEKTGALGIPEFGTSFVRRMLSTVKVTSFADLVAISGLSHGTDVWANNAEVLVREQHLQLTEIISCRDDIMVYLIKKGLPDKDAFFIMERVRKGQPLLTEEIALLRKFAVPEWYIDSCLKIKYIFPKAHATAYVKMAWRIAWYKIYYPLEYYATFFSARNEAFDIFTMIKGQRYIEQKLAELMKRKNSSKPNLKLTTKEATLINPLQLAQEMFARGFKIESINLEKSHAWKWQINYDDQSLIPPFNTVDGLGLAVAQSIVKAREEKPFFSIEDLEKRTQINKTHMNLFKEEGILKNLVERNQISFNLFD